MQRTFWVTFGVHYVAGDVSSVFVFATGQSATALVPSSLVGACNCVCNQLGELDADEADFDICDFIYDTRSHRWRFQYGVAAFLGAHF